MAPPEHDDWPIPQFNLRIEDLSHEGVSVFLNNVDPTTALRDALVQGFQTLYTYQLVPRSIQVITLVLKQMDGVAFCFGSATHKEMHFSLQHIKNKRSLAKSEIMGVLVHELVHCMQYNGHGTCPGGLVEGIADFVRLRAGLAPPHWKRVPGETWDSGYDKTAYFLDWLENRYGEGTVQEINLAMKDAEYHRRIFKQVTGRPVRKLWQLYCESFGEALGNVPPAPNPEPTHGLLGLPQPNPQGDQTPLEDWEKL